MRHISKDTRNSITSLVDAGLSTREIKTQLNVGHMTLSRVRARARPDAQKNRGGRSAELTTTNKRRLVRMVTSGKVDNAVQLRRELNDIANVECSVQTVRRALKEAGLKAVSKKKSRNLCLGTSANVSTLPCGTGTGL